jgi:hypothetical protein
MAAYSPCLHHLYFATRPGAGSFDRLSRTRVLRLSGLKEVKDVLGTRCRPQGEKLVIRIGEGPTAADRHEARVAVFQEDHIQRPFCSHLPNGLALRRPLDTIPGEISLSIPLPGAI